MNWYRDIAYPLARRRDAESVHDLAMKRLALLGTRRAGRALLRWISGGKAPALPVEAAGLVFPNPLGLAAGFDKDAQALPAFSALGFGHVEAGTLTPRPQPGNPKPRIFRLLKDDALINRMGFPNHGVDAAIPRLRRARELAPELVIGLSLGKQKETPLKDAAADYLEVLRKAGPLADYLAVNISSPNTPGLRELQGARFIGELCRRIADAVADLPGQRRPVFVKIAPDMTRAELDALLDAALSAGVDGLIATNTTLARTNLSSPERGETGGLSGAPLFKKSTSMVRYIRRHAGPGLAIIAAGGIRDGRTALAKLNAGADLLQVYTGFVYEGPAMAPSTLRWLAAGDWV